MQNSKCKELRFASCILPFALHRCSDVCDGLCVEDLIVFFEEPRDAGLVDLHLEVANTERPERRDTRAIGFVVSDLNAFYAERWHRVDVHSNLQARTAHPRVLRHEAHTRGTGTEEHFSTLERGVGSGHIGRRHLTNSDAESFLNAPAQAAISHAARRHGDLRACLREKTSGTDTNRT